MSLNTKTPKTEKKDWISEIEAVKFWLVCYLLITSLTSFFLAGPAEEHPWANAITAIFMVLPSTAIFIIRIFRPRSKRNPN